MWAASYCSLWVMIHPANAFAEQSCSSWDFCDVSLQSSTSWTVCIVGGGATSHSWSEGFKTSRVKSTSPLQSIINGPKEYITLFLFNIKQTFQSSVSQLLLKFVWWQEIGQMISWALWLAQLCELALQEHSGNTKSLLLVDRLSQDVVVSDTLEARLLTQLGQKLWKQKQRA